MNPSRETFCPDCKERLSFPYGTCHRCGEQKPVMHDILSAIAGQSVCVGCFGTPYNSRYMEFVDLLRWVLLGGPCLQRKCSGLLETPKQRAVSLLYEDRRRENLTAP